LPPGWVGNRLSAMFAANARTPIDTAKIKAISTIHIRIPNEGVE